MVRAMKKFEITITETSSATFIVEANSREEAMGLWMDNSDKYAGYIDGLLDDGYEGREITDVHEVAEERESDFTYQELTEKPKKFTVQIGIDGYITHTVMAYSLAEAQAEAKRLAELAMIAANVRNTELRIPEEV